MFLQVATNVFTGVKNVFTKVFLLGAKMFLQVATNVFLGVDRARGVGERAKTCPLRLEPKRANP